MPNLWKRRLGGVAAGRGLMRSLLLRQRLKRQATSGHAITEVSNPSDLAFWQQGDSTFYTPEMLEQRTAIRGAKPVVDILHIWWETALACDPASRWPSQQQHAEARAHACAAVAATGESGMQEATLSREGYLVMLSKLYKVMIETGEYDAAEARACAAEDYDRDLQGMEAMTRSLCCDALFELADLWVQTAETQDYVDFLWALLRAIAIPIGRAGEPDGGGGGGSGDCGLNGMILAASHDSSDGGGNGGVGAGDGGGRSESGDCARFRWKDDEAIEYDPNYEEWGAVAEAEAEDGQDRQDVDRATTGDDNDDAFAEMGSSGGAIQKGRKRTACAHRLSYSRAARLSHASRSARGLKRPSFVLASKRAHGHRGLNVNMLCPNVSMDVNCLCVRECAHRRGRLPRGGDSCLAKWRTQCSCRSCSNSCQRGRSAPLAASASQSR